jgi:hypothetical protein
MMDFHAPPGLSPSWMYTTRERWYGLIHTETVLVGSSVSEQHRAQRMRLRVFRMPFHLL